MLLHVQVPACEAKLIRNFLRRNHVSGPPAAVVLLVGRNLRILTRQVSPVESLVRLEKTLCVIRYGNQENKTDNLYSADDAPMAISREKGPSV